MRRKLVAARLEEERADMWDPHVSDKGEKCSVARRRKPMEKSFSCQGAMGHAGLLGR
jgi:hypothetical protein